MNQKNSIPQENIEKFWHIVKANEGWCPLQFVFGLIANDENLRLNTKFSFKAIDSVLCFLEEQIKLNKITIQYLKPRLATQEEVNTLNSKYPGKSVEYGHAYETEKIILFSNAEQAEEMRKTILNDWKNSAFPDVTFLIAVVIKPVCENVSIRQ
jgi:hypothetical protein